VFELRRWILHRDGVFISLLELFHGHLCGVGWIECMQCLLRWFILRHDWFIRSEWQLFSWVVFSCLSDRLLFLSCWEFSSHSELVELFVVHSRVVLRHDRSDCSVGRMRCGFILGRVCNCVFELFIW